MLTSILGWAGNVAIVAGLWGIGNQRRGAFLFSIVGESAWIVKSTINRQWDLAFICVIFAALAIRSWVKWGSKCVAGGNS